jgi:hypothetical protein
MIGQVSALTEHFSDVDVTGYQRYLNGVPDRRAERQERFSEEKLVKPDLSKWRFSNNLTFD